MKKTNILTVAMIMAFLMFVNPMRVNAAELFDAVVVEEQQLNRELINAVNMSGQRNYDIVLSSQSVKIVNEMGVELSGSGTFQLTKDSLGQYDEETQQFVATPSYLGRFTGLNFVECEIQNVTLTRSDANSQINLQGTLIFDGYLYHIYATCLPRPDISVLGGKVADVSSIVNTDLLSETLELTKGTIYTSSKQLIGEVKVGQVFLKNTNATEKYSNETNETVAYKHAVGTILADVTNGWHLSDAKLISVVRIENKAAKTEYIQAIMLCGGQKYWFFGETKMVVKIVEPSYSSGSSHSSSGSGNKNDNKDEGNKEETIDKPDKGNNGIIVNPPNGGSEGVHPDVPDTNGGIQVPTTEPEAGKDADKVTKPITPSNGGIQVPNTELEAGKEADKVAEEVTKPTPPANEAMNKVPSNIEEGQTANTDNSSSE